MRLSAGPGDADGAPKPRRRSRPGRLQHQSNRVRSTNMAEFTAKDVQALRNATGAGMMDAKRA